jgi:hypothetical protein
LEIFNGHLVYFVVIWYIFPHFGILDQEKSGNPAIHKDPGPTEAELEMGKRPILDCLWLDICGFLERFLNFSQDVDFKTSLVSDIDSL